MVPSELAVGGRPSAVDGQKIDDILEQAEKYRLYIRQRDAAHYQMALIQRGREKILGVPVIVLTAVVGTAIFATLQEEASVIWQIATGLLSVLAAVLAALQTFFNYGSEAARHEKIAARYARLRRTFSSFKLKYSGGRYTREECLTALEGIAEEIDVLEQEAPRIPNRLWDRTKRKVPTVDPYEVAGVTRAQVISER